MRASGALTARLSAAAALHLEHRVDQVAGAHHAVPAGVTRPKPAVNRRVVGCLTRTPAGDPVVLDSRTRARRLIRTSPPTAPGGRAERERRVGVMGRDETPGAPRSEVVLPRAAREPRPPAGIVTDATDGSCQALT